MLTNRRRALAASIVITLLLLTTTSFAWADPKYKLGTAKGDGTIKVGSEEMKITTVVIKLLENGRAEINLISEMQFFITGKWSRGTSPNEINLQITPDAATTGFEGSGK